MNAYDHQLLAVTWVAVEMAGTAMAARFYEELFARDSSLRLLFLDADLTTSGRALLRGVGIAVANVGRLERVVSRGPASGVAPPHVATSHVVAPSVVTPSTVRLVRTSNLAAQSLLAAIAYTLGPAWTPEVCDVWTAFCALLSASQRQIVRAASRAA